MKLSIGTFYLIYFTIGLAKLSPSQELENRDIQIYYTLVAPSNRIHEKPSDASQDYKHQRVARSDLNSWRTQRTDYRRDQKRENDESVISTQTATTVFRTFGRGRAQITRPGQAVNVPNELGRNIYKDSVAAKVDKNENEIKPSRHRMGCKECPPDQTVIATKGNTFAILPEPCPMNPRMWNHHSGPRPGNKVQEGVHSIRGYLGPKKKFCQYHYQVLVRQCEPLKAKEEDTIIECSANNSWGSFCNISCGSEKEPIGPTNLECRENLTWSNPVPTCKSKNDCSAPTVKTNSKISCQTANMTQVEGDFIPNGSVCKFLQNEKEISINCKDGRWRIIRKNLPRKKNKQKSKTELEKTDPCNPSPCQNGGTCLKPESNKGHFLCKCRPKTQGVHCEMRECYYNICENNGLCFFQNEERICYCPSEYRGDTCQNYTPQ